MSLLEKAANAEPVWQFRLMAALLILGYTPEALEASVLNPLMDVNQVARLLGCHPETVRRMTRDRTLHAVNVGGRWRYRMTQVEDDLASWTERRAAYYSKARWEKAEAKRTQKRRRELGLDEETP